MAPKIGLGRCLGASGAAPGASWGHLGPRAPKPGSRYHLEPSKLDPKIDKKLILSRSRSDRFFHKWLGRVLVPIGANVAPTWRPKPLQNQPKLAPNWSQVGNFENQVESYMRFGQHSRNLGKRMVSMILVSSSPQDDPAWHQIRIQKIDQNSIHKQEHRNQDARWVGIWTPLGTIFAEHENWSLEAKNGLLEFLF